MKLSQFLMSHKRVREANYRGSLQRKILTREGGKLSSSPFVACEQSPFCSKKRGEEANEQKRASRGSRFRSIDR